MYGLRPRAITEKFAKVPPENTSKSAKNWFWENKILSCARSTPETGMWAKILVIRKMSLKLCKIYSGDGNMRKNSGN